MVSLAKNLFIYQSIKTSLHKAKAAKPLIEKLISLAKQNTLAAKRQVFKLLGDHKLVSYIFSEIGPRFAKIQSGYTRIINLARRRGDNAQIVILELTQIKKKEVKKPKQELAKEKPSEEKKPEAKGVAVKEKPPIAKKPTKKFLGGLRNIFKKERDSL